MAKSVVLPRKLLWLDLEMTGLNSQYDLIVELAVLITDFSFNVLAKYQTGVYQPPADLEQRLKLNLWFQKQPSAYQAQIKTVSQKGKDLKLIEADLLKLVSQHWSDQPVILAGNSIYVDRSFVANYLPQLTARLHYRMLDVSAFKIYMLAQGLEFNKKENHRALDDIYESIAELKFYLKYFKL